MVLTLDTTFSVRPAPCGIPRIRRVITLGRLIEKIVWMCLLTKSETAAIIMETRGHPNRMHRHHQVRHLKMGTEILIININPEKKVALADRTDHREDMARQEVTGRVDRLEDTVPVSPLEVTDRTDNKEVIDPTDQKVVPDRMVRRELMALPVRTNHLLHQDRMNLTPRVIQALAPETNLTLLLHHLINLKTPSKTLVHLYRKRYAREKGFTE